MPRDLSSSGNQRHIPRPAPTSPHKCPHGGRNFVSPNLRKFGRGHPRRMTCARSYAYSRDSVPGALREGPRSAPSTPEEDQVVMGQIGQLLNGGSLARWTMPTRPGDLAQPPARSEPRLRSARPLSDDAQTLRVLLIEDNPGDADWVEEHLSELGHHRVEITRAPRLEEGLRELISQAFDAVIVDLSLPDASPAQTLAHIRKTRESVAIVVLSGSDDDHMRREALRSGAQEFLTKGTGAGLDLGRCLLGAVDRHRAQSSQRQLERWMAATPEAVIVNDESGQVQFVNVAALQLFGR